MGKSIRSKSKKASRAELRDHYSQWRDDRTNRLSEKTLKCSMLEGNDPEMEVEADAPTNTPSEEVNETEMEEYRQRKKEKEARIGGTLTKEGIDRLVAEHRANKRRRKSRRRTYLRKTNKIP